MTSEPAPKGPLASPARGYQNRPAPGPGPCRILLVGTSQTWGAGARRSTDVWTRVLERELNGGAQAGDRGFVVINFGFPGGWAPFLLDVYRDEGLQADPALVLVDLGNNDQVGSDFRQGAAWLRGDES